MNYHLLTIEGKMPPSRLAKWLSLSLPFLILVLTVSLHAQDPHLDSLRNHLNSLGPDAARVDVLNEIAATLFRADPGEAIRYASEARDLAEKIGYAGGEALAYKNLGLCHYMQGEFAEALQNWDPSLEIYRSLGDDQLISNILSNMGAAYHATGKNVEAIEHYLPSLKIAEKLNDSNRIGTLLLNLGVIYSEQTSTLDTAIRYYKDAIAFGAELGNFEIMGVGAINLGEVYLE